MFESWFEFEMQLQCQNRCLIGMKNDLKGNLCSISIGRYILYYYSTFRRKSWMLGVAASWKKVKVFTCQFNFHEAWWSDRKVPEKFLFRVLKEGDACSFIPQWAKTCKKDHFGRTMHYLPQRLKSTFFEKKNFTLVSLQRPSIHSRKLWEILLLAFEANSGFSCHVSAF